ncbi:MAG: radical SAM family heme chaperone HemW [Bacteroidales bacterium]
MAGIYIHIPFCRQKCHYCNFYSVASLKLRQGFISSLIREIELQKEYLGKESINTVYFGGGTPSMLSPEEINEVLRHLSRHFSVSPDAEITIEANPDDITDNKVYAWKDMGINRISLGVQSFHDKDLDYLFRSHNGNRALDAMDTILHHGFQNLSIDLIYGIPTLSEENWKNNLMIVSSYHIPHLSAYWLTVEEGTALDKLVKNSKLPGPEDDKGIQHFRQLQQWAVENNYLHYEISNLGKESYFSRHNQSYWKGDRYLGLGPSAHSYNGCIRQWNVSSIGVYKEKLALGIIPAETETITPLMHYEEIIMTGLRTMWGVDLIRLEDTFGKRIKDLCLLQAQPFLEKEDLRLDGEALVLNPASYLISDFIISELFIAAEDWD